MTDSSLLSKVWNFAHVVRGYGEYLEQITYLLFLNMADEMAQPSTVVQFARYNHFRFVFT